MQTDSRGKTELQLSRCSWLTMSMSAKRMTVDMRPEALQDN